MKYGGLGSAAYEGCSPWGSSGVVVVVGDSFQSSLSVLAECGPDSGMTINMKTVEDALVTLLTKFPIDNRGRSSYAPPHCLLSSWCSRRCLRHMCSYLRQR